MEGEGTVKEGLQGGSTDRKGIASEGRRGAAGALLPLSTTMARIGAPRSKIYDYLGHWLRYTARIASSQTKGAPTVRLERNQDEGYSSIQPQ